MRAGLSTLLMQQLILLGTFFVLPVYLQVVLGLDAFETGKRLLPMSVTMLLFALAGPRLAERFAPRGVARLGLVALVIGAFGLLGTVDVELDDWDFAGRARLLRRGCRPAPLTARQRDHVLRPGGEGERGRGAAGDGAEPRRVAGHGPDRLGAARRPDDRVRGADRDEPGAAGRGADADRRSRRGGVDIVPVDQARQVAVDAGLPPDQADAVVEDYGEAQLDALRRSLLAVAFAGIVAFWVARRLPGRPLHAPPPAT